MTGADKHYQVAQEEQSLESKGKEEEVREVRDSACRLSLAWETQSEALLDALLGEALENEKRRNLRDARIS